jgi:hypothetical protein
MKAAALHLCWIAGNYPPTPFAISPASLAGSWGRKYDFDNLDLLGQPVKSVQELKSVQEVKDITPIDDSVARRAIKQFGLRNQLEPRTRREGELEDVDVDAIRSLLSSEEDDGPAVQAGRVRPLGEQQQKIVDKEQEMDSLIDGEIKEKEEEIEADEKIVEALIKVKAKHLHQIKNILSLKDVREVESIDKVKSIQPIKSINEVN